MTYSEPTALGWVSDCDILVRLTKTPMATEEPTKLTQPQLDLLALFQHTDLPDEDWIEIRRMIARFFAERATETADQIVDEQRWVDEDFERMARGHLRHTP